MSCELWIRKKVEGIMKVMIEFYLFLFFACRLDMGMQRLFFGFGTGFGSHSHDIFVFYFLFVLFLFV